MLHGAGRELELSDFTDRDGSPDAAVPEEAIPAAGPLAEIQRDAQSRESELIRRVLEDHHWNQTAAADHLGISRRALYAKIQKYGLH
jgi:DNA-binding NtrC family response regulator